MNFQDLINELSTDYILNEMKYTRDFINDQMHYKMHDLISNSFEYGELVKDINNANLMGAEIAK